MIKIFTIMNKSTQTCVDCETTKDAAKNGHLECLERLHKLGRSWDVDTFSDAAEGGHLDCLKYAHENGCPCRHSNKTKTKKSNVHCVVL